MEKGNISLKDLVAIMSPQATIQVFEGGRQEELFKGKKAELTRNPIIGAGYEVNHFNWENEYYLLEADGKITQVGKLAANDKKFIDISVRLLVRVYLY